MSITLGFSHLLHFHNKGDSVLSCQYWGERPDSSDREDETKRCFWQQHGVQYGSVAAAANILFGFYDPPQSCHWPRTREMNNMNQWECPCLHLTNIMGPLFGHEPCGDWESNKQDG